MKVVLITIQFLYGITQVEISNKYMVTYNYYGKDLNPKDVLIFDFEKESLYKVNPQTYKFQKENLRALNAIPQNELLWSHKLEDSLYLEKYNCEVYLETYKVGQSKIHQRESVLKIKKVYGKLVELDSLELDKSALAYIPFVGNSIKENSSITFSCHEVNDFQDKSESILIYEIKNTNCKSEFSVFAKRILNIISD